MKLPAMVLDVDGPVLLPLVEDVVGGKKKPLTGVVPDVTVEVTGGMTGGGHGALAWAVRKLRTNVETPLAPPSQRPWACSRGEAAMGAVSNGE